MLELILATCLTSTIHAPFTAPALEPAPRSSAAVIQEKTASKDLFPAPKTGITLHVGDNGNEMSMFDLCAAYAQVTGQRATYGEDTESLLKQRRVKLDRSLDVEPEDLQLVFETMMIGSDFVIIPVLGEPTPIFHVDSLQGAGRSNLRANATYVDPDDAVILENHPAVLFTTTVQLPNVDVRQLSNSMRTMITDANTQQMLPAGSSNSMVLVGFGSNLSALRSMLLIINDAAGANVEDMMARVEVLRIENADAEDLAKIISLTFGANLPQGPQGPQRYRPLTVLSDERTNSLVIRGTRDQVARIKELVVELDIEIKAKGKK